MIAAYKLICNRLGDQGYQYVLKVQTCETAFTLRSAMSIPSCFTMLTHWLITFRSNGRIHICYRQKIIHDSDNQKKVIALCTGTVLKNSLLIIFLHKNRLEKTHAQVTQIPNILNLTLNNILWFILMRNNIIFKKWTLVLKTMEKAMFFSLILPLLLCQNYSRRDAS